MNKLLVIGGSGLVGSTIIKYSKQFDVYSTFNKNKENLKNSYKITLPQETDKLTKLIKTLKPQFTIHTVAYPSVDFCELNKHDATALHVDSIRDITKACNEINSKLIFLSTDAVFEGELGKKYTENDHPNPINFYGKTKLQAENIVLSYSSNVVLRTAVIYGWHKKSRFTNWIIDSLSTKKSVDPFVDQYNTPTLVDDLAKSILKILEMNLNGLYHATGRTCINRFDFARLIAQTFKLDTELIKPVTKNEKKQDAPRPISTCLDSKKLEDSINYKFCTVDNGISFLYNKSKEYKQQLGISS